MGNPLELLLRMTADVGNVDRAFDDVGSSARAMSDDVSAAADKAEASTRGLDRVAGSAENLDDKAGRATGALGALSSGFELVGMEKYATGLQSASMATDFFSGVGQSAMLVLEGQYGAQIKATAASVKDAAVKRTQAVATRTLAVAQRVLNAVMRANPLGLAITAALLLAGLFVTLYKRSETFRNIVQSAGRMGRQALGWVIDSAKGVGRWIGDLPKKVGSFVDKMGWAKTLVVGYFRVITTPARTLLNIIKAVVDWISKIDFPDLPGWANPFGRVAARAGGGGKAGLVGASQPGGASGGGVTVVNQITVQGAFDAMSVAAQLRSMLLDLARAQGWAVAV